MLRQVWMLCFLLPCLLGFQPSQSDEDLALAELTTLNTLLSQNDCDKVAKALDTYDVTTLNTVLQRMGKRYRDMQQKKVGTLTPAQQAFINTLKRLKRTTVELTLRCSAQGSTRVLRVPLVVGFPHEFSEASLIVAEIDRLRIIIERPGNCDEVAKGIQAFDGKVLREAMEAFGKKYKGIKPDAFDEEGRRVYDAFTRMFKVLMKTSRECSDNKAFQAAEEKLKTIFK